MVIEPLEVRAFAECRVDVTGRTLRGYPIVFGVASTDLGGFVEQIAPEAVDRTLRNGIDVRALANHNDAQVLARRSAGTLQLRKDARGLEAVMELDDQITYARDVLRAVARGDVTGMSFRFQTISDEWDRTGTRPLRTVRDMIIREISTVAFPAYEATDVHVAMRSLASFDRAQAGSHVAWLQRRLRLTRT